MKRSFLFLISLFLCFSTFGAHVFYLHSGGEIVEDEKCSDLDTLRFIDGQALFSMEGDEMMVYEIDAIDSLSFEEILVASDTVFVTFQDGQDPVVVNPLENDIEVTIEEGGVFVNCHSQLENVVYSLSGSSSDGYFHIESERKFTVQLNNLNLASKGVLAPIRSFAGSSMNLELKGENRLADSSADTCNAVLRSKGQIVFVGEGALSVVANSKRGIQSGDYIEINSGTVSVIAPYGDALKMNDYFEMNGGALLVLGYGVEVEKGYMQINGGSINYVNRDSEDKYIDDAKGLKCDGDTLLPITPENGSITINGGLLTFDVGGEVSRFIRCSGDVIVNGGTINGVLNATPFYDSEIDDISYQCIVKADGMIKMLGGNHDLTISEVSYGGRGLVADNSIIFDGGVKLNLNIACSPYYKNYDESKKPKYGYGLKTDYDVIMNNCDVNISSELTANSGIPVSSYTFEVNEGAKVQLISYSNVFSKVLDVIKLKGGQVITIAPSCTDMTETTAAGGVMISLGLKGYGNHYITASSPYASIKYAATVGNAINIKSKDGLDMLTYQLPTSINALTSGSVYMFIYGPYGKTVDYDLSSGGVISGGTEWNGIYQSATYSGGNSISFKPNALLVEVK